MLEIPVRLGYQSSLGPRQPAQVALRMAGRETAALLPPGYRTRVSGASQNLPHIPWLAILDEDVTTTAREGLYVVYSPPTASAAAPAACKKSRPTNHQNVLCPFPPSAAAPKRQARNTAAHNKRCHSRGLNVRKATW
jgi:hypothetical protein